MASKYIVILKDGSHAWGPFADPERAETFRDFVEKNIDPAQVVPIGSPKGEVRSWVKATF